MGIFKSKKTTEKKSDTEKKDKAVAKKTTTKKTSMKDLYRDNKTVAKTSQKKEEKIQSPSRGSAYKILLKPLITEKAASLGVDNKYVFEVSKDSNKISIADAVNEVYGERPVSVNIVNMKGKKVRYGRTMGRRKDWKKAVVTLAKGKTINIYEGV